MFVYQRVARALQPCLAHAAGTEGIIGTALTAGAAAAVMKGTCFKLFGQVLLWPQGLAAGSEPFIPEHCSLRCRSLLSTFHERDSQKPIRHPTAAAVTSQRPKSAVVCAGENACCWCGSARNNNNKLLKFHYSKSLLKQHSPPTTLSCFASYSRFNALHAE